MLSERHVRRLVGLMVIMPMHASLYLLRKGNGEHLAMGINPLTGISIYRRSITTFIGVKIGVCMFGGRI